MGNKVLLKVDSKVSVVMEQALRMLHECGLPTTDVDFINCEGSVMHDLLLTAQPRMNLFTGSSKVAELLAKDLHGKNIITLFFFIHTNDINYYFNQRY